MVNHSFDVYIAEKYGINSAVILNHLFFWIAKNEANNKNFHEGRYWTYNSHEAFAKLFPYMTARQISYALDKLIKSGLVVTGNYNESPYDRTLWYAITDFGYSIIQNCKMDETTLSNGDDDLVKSYTDIKPNINTDINTNIKPQKGRQTFCDSAVDEFIKDEEVPISTEQEQALKKAVKDFVEMRAKKRNEPTRTALAKLLVKAYEEANHDINLMMDVFDQSTMKGWQGVFGLKKESKGNRSYCTGKREDGGEEGCPF